MKTALVIGSLLLLSGCGGWNKFSAHVTGWTRECIDGVSYLQFPSGATVEYTKEGKIKTCN